MLSLELATARTWAEIDVDKILFNYHSALSELAPGVRHITVLKANAYGLGAAMIAKILYAEGMREFAVACVMEALELRRALPPDADILVLGDCGEAEMPLALEYGIMLTIFSCETARALSKLATEMWRTARVHCKVDTGLNRLGFDFETAAEGVEETAKLHGIRLEGLFSHLARRSTWHDHRQVERLMAVRDQLASRGVEIPLLHMLDSIGMWRYPEYQFGAVRDAAFVMGHTPQDYPRPENIKFSLSLKTRIVRIHDVKAGECLGYDSENPLPRDMRVATLCIGYADGYPRALSGKGQAEIHGKRANVLGVVCMDLLMVDVSEIPEAKVGDIATMLGGSISIFEYAGFGKGYCNEYMAMISRRVPRVYLRGGQVQEIVGYME